MHQSMPFACGPMPPQIKLELILHVFVTCGPKCLYFKRCISRKWSKNPSPSLTSCSLITFHTVSPDWVTVLATCLPSLPSVVWNPFTEREQKPGNEWRWEQVVKQCEKHEGGKTTDTCSWNPTWFLHHIPAEFSWQRLGGYTQSPALNHSADTVWGEAHSRGWYLEGIPFIKWN